MPEKHFTRATIVAAQQELGDELTREGVHGQIFIVGGAAMALAYSTRRVTKDIDAVFEPKAVIYQAASRVAERLGLPDDWINDAAKGFMPGSDEDARPIPDVRGIEILSACTPTVSRHSRHASSWKNCSGLQALRSRPVP